MEICFICFFIFGIGFSSASILSEMDFFSRPINLEWMKEKAVKPFPLADFQPWGFLFIVVKTFPPCWFELGGFLFIAVKTFPPCWFQPWGFLFVDFFFFDLVFFYFFFEWDVFLSHPMTLDLMKEKVVKTFPPC